MSKWCLRTGLFLSVFTIALSTSAAAQETTTNAEKAAGEQRSVGTLTTIGRGAMILRTDEGSFVVFVIDPDTEKPKTGVAPGTRVAVVTMADSRDDPAVALAIYPLPPREGLGAPPEDPVPQSVRRVESRIEAQAARWRAGFALGAAVDPELISMNGSAMLGPFFRSDVAFRPGVEFAFGEVTKLFGINLDALYQLRNVSRNIRWAPYLGTGLNLQISHRGFENDQGDDIVDFGDWSWNTGVNFIIGVRNNRGASFEMRATAWSNVVIRLLGGYSFTF